MINLKNQVPAIYTDASRDFQYLSGLINIVLNSVKHNVDDLYALPSTKADPRLAELLALTLGFKVKRNYDQKQLAALVSIIPSLLKYKGTETAIQMAGDALITASGASGVFYCEAKDNLLEVLIPKELVDTTLFLDLLPYILPAGMTCKVVRKTKVVNTSKTIVRYEGNLCAEWHEDLSWDADKQTSTGLSELFTLGNKPNFANYAHDSNHEACTLNAGLLNNSVIPVVSDVMGSFDETEATQVQQTTPEIEV